MNDTFYGSYYQNESIITEKSKQIIIEPNESNLTHIKEIFIYFTNLSTGNKERVLDLLTILFGDKIQYRYSSLDLDIYQKTTRPEHNSSIPNPQPIYSIGFSLYPKNNHPSGLVNVSKEHVKFTFDLKSGVRLQNYNTTIIFFGYKVFSDDL